MLNKNTDPIGLMVEFSALEQKVETIIKNATYCFIGKYEKAYGSAVKLFKGRVVCETVYGFMHYKDITWLINKSDVNTVTDFSLVPLKDKK